jgi:DNA-binding NarL/FixJ family response regulator
LKPAQQRVRVVCVDDNHDVVHMLGLVIDGEPDLQCVGSAQELEQLAETVRANAADVVVLDASMPGCDPIEAMRDLLTVCPDVRVVVYSGYDDAATIDRAIEAGACGYVSKDAPIEKLVGVVRGVAAGSFEFPTH